ncbi:hypothetical protein L226DRAFT_538972 [Lentinus tigrinus ALCF2SS1-7]|uniref:F-box domain-containing protein n=1 Tax=Lentinus tigrinus ALCF2SS1-6 TaxID=1328759 RepID=A0A5C2RTY3_9APHY|nr:hypothetical protein L227DRAFT_615612 [Lentinus tigrinus ALCF2SS1-6]RPD70326.1 hypothetical protein L226DRAFT_538972 [Lentinus tigrinus ALCF2SS1-7]
MTPASADKLSTSISPVYLPIELWLAIIHYTADPDTLAQIVRLNKAFHREVEPLLYRAVHLRSHDSVGLFLRTLSDSISPRHVQLVGSLTVMVNDTETEPFACPRHHHGPPVPEKGTNYNAILVTRFPALRRFVTDMSAVRVFNFVRKHADTLEDLRIFNMLMPSDEGGTKLPFRSLRSLRSPQSALNHVSVSGGKTLTHLHLPALDSLPGLLAIPGSFGARLVSLRLGFSTLLMRRGGDTERGSLGAIAARFTQLRYLQIDVPHAVQPTLSGLQGMQPVWTRGLKSSSTDAGRTTGVRRSPGARITLAWVSLNSPRGVHSNSDGVDVGAWLKFLNHTALDVLVEWRDLVERIVYRHQMVQPVSVALDESGTVLVRRLDSEMSEDYWESVVPSSRGSG